jgi:hypothetical protein
MYDYHFHRIYFLSDDHIGMLDGAIVENSGTLNGITYTNHYLDDEKKLFFFTSENNAAGISLSKRLPELRAGVEYQIKLNMQTSGLTPFHEVIFYDEQNNEITSTKDNPFRAPENFKKYQIAIYAKGRGSAHFESFDLVKVHSLGFLLETDNQLTKNVSYLYEENKSIALLVTFYDLHDNLHNYYWNDAFKDLAISQLHFSNINLHNDLYLVDEKKIIETIKQYATKKIYFIGVGISAITASFCAQKLASEYETKVYLSNPIFKPNLSSSDILTRTIKFPADVEIQATKIFTENKDIIRTRHHLAQIIQEIKSEEEI